MNNFTIPDYVSNLKSFILTDAGKICLSYYPSDAVIYADQCFMEDWLSGRNITEPWGLFYNYLVSKYRLSDNEFISMCLMLERQDPPLNKKSQKYKEIHPDLKAEFERNAKGNGKTRNRTTDGTEFIFKKDKDLTPDERFLKRCWSCFQSWKHYITLPHHQFMHETYPDFNCLYYTAKNWIQYKYKDKLTQIIEKFPCLANIDFTVKAKADHERDGAEEAAKIHEMFFQGKMDKFAQIMGWNKDQLASYVNFNIEQWMYYAEHGKFMDPFNSHDDFWDNL